jgi:hypothetical protein
VTFAWNEVSEYSLISDLDSARTEGLTSCFVSRRVPDSTPRWLRIQWMPILLLASSLLIALLFWLAVFVLPERMAPATQVPNAADRLKAQNDIRTTLIQALAGIGLLTGAFFTARTFILNKEGQITDRFTKAIGQLGNKNLDIRLGGIYALERIARESKRDQWPIMEVLTTYLREHFPASGADERSNEGTLPDRLAADAQAVLTVIARRKWREREPGWLNLNDTDLRKAHLFEAHLEEALLGRARLEGANLSQAHLKGATLEHAHCEGAYLSQVHLEDAVLIKAHLQGAALIDAHLEGASLQGAHLEGAYLTQVHLEGARADSATTWPTGFDPESAGVTFIQERNRP